MIASPTDHWPRQSEAASFFGRIELGHDGLPTARSEARSLITVQAPYPMRLAWQPSTVVRRLTCHRLVAQSLTHCLSEILSLYGSLEEVRKAGLDLYGGCYNFRPMRGGHALSMHSYGAAIDLDPEHNPFGQKWSDHKGMMPLEVVEIFESAGWTWAGRSSSNPNPMHFQAASI